MLPDPNKNNPPELLGANVDVPMGDSASIDLRRLTSDPDGDDVDKMKYELLDGTPAGFTVSVDGRNLKVSAADSSRAGTAGAVQVKARDPRGLEATATLPAVRDGLQPAQTGGQRRR